MMVLPNELEADFKEEFKRIQEEAQVPYITNIELDGMVKASRESSIAALEVRFGTVPAEISEILEAINDIDVLKQLHRQAVVIGSVEEFQQLLNEVSLPKITDK